jgi:hypothetical protein
VCEKSNFAFIISKEHPSKTNPTSHPLPLRGHPHPPFMCDRWTQSRRQCHSLYGKQGEDCLREELAEKRCLSHHHCPHEASRYYGRWPPSSISNNSNKALCASWAEAFAFRDDMDEQQNDNHHGRAAAIVNASQEQQQKCRRLAMDLAKCLRQNYRYEP